MKKLDDILQRIADGGAVAATVRKLKRGELRRLVVGLAKEENPCGWREEILTTAFAEAAARYLKKS